MSDKHASGSGKPRGAPIQQWDGAMPILMSVVVLMMVVVELCRHGLHASHHDEGTPDHVATMLMFGQVPIMFWFVASRRHPALRILPTLAIQLALWAIAFASAVRLT